MDIIIGREEGAEKPRLCLKSGEKTIFVGAPGSVSRKVSRKHCCLRLDAEGNIESVTDLTQDNFMYVNGRECKSKSGLRITDVVELGPDRYPLDLSLVVRLFAGNAPKDAAGLGEVYGNYQKALMEIQVRQGKFNALSSLPMLFSMASGILAAYVEEARFIGIALALIFIVGFAVLRYKMAASVPRQRKELDDKFHREYACPSCGQYLGSLRPEDLAKRGSCPFCKAKLTGV